MEEIEQVPRNERSLQCVHRAWQLSSVPGRVRLVRSLGMKWRHAYRLPAHFRSLSDWLWRGVITRHIHPDQATSRKQRNGRKDVPFHNPGERWVIRLSRGFTVDAHQSHKLEDKKGEANRENTMVQRE